MTIAESQLETWSHQGSVQQSSSTYQTIKGALENSRATYADKSFTVFLQGSYGNDTNIYAESDVDSVILLHSIFRFDLSALPADQAAHFRQATGTATYTFDLFKQGVVTRLSNAFAVTDVKPDNKAIKIKANGSRRSADVVACYEYRRYTRFISENDCRYTSGIIFPTTSSGEIINYPKLHSENLTARHQATNTWLKPMVRIVKNMRSRLVNNNVISKSLAPSYYIEGMLYNVPNSVFGTSYGNTLYNCLNWLLQADRSQLNCAHGQHRLLGSGNTQWPSGNCTQFLDALVKLWNDW